MSEEVTKIRGRGMHRLIRERLHMNARNPLLVGIGWMKPMMSPNEKADL